MMANDQEIYGNREAEKRPLLRAMGRGFRMKCPDCASGPLFTSYAKTAPTCTQCGLEISGHQADDAPPYITIMVVGHIAIPLALASKQLLDPPLWQQFAVWLPIILFATFWLLPRAKGAMVGLQWANRMHGFGEDDATTDGSIAETSEIRP